MIWTENVRTAISALRANLMRSMLTTLGIVIGTAAVVAVVSLLQGLEHMITKDLQGVGATYIIVTPQDKAARPGMMPRPIELSWDDGKALRDQVPTIDRITPLLMRSGTLKHRDHQHSTLVMGVTDAWPDVNNHTVDRGRFFSQIDLDHRRKVVVLGQKVVDELNLGANPIGKEIYVGKLPATVIGVMEERGQSLGQDTDDLAFVPFDTAIAVFGRRAANQVQLRLHATSPDSVDATRDGIKTVLRKRHKLREDEEDDFGVIVQDELLETISGTLGSVTAVAGAVVGVALIVGGIGIMNILLVSVTERTREIGLRKAIGARRQDILVQFLVEAVVLSILGGAIGIALGYGLGMAIAAIMPGGWPSAYVPAWAIALSFGFSGLVGVFFGIYPAAKASRLDPIEALRYE